MDNWPAPPAAEAFSGLAGEVVAAIEPYTEGDSAAVLIQFLAAFASAVGSGPHFNVGAERHNLKIWPVIVGDSAKARKGASWAPAKLVVGNADPSWLPRVVSGLSTGEGLIEHVRDEIATFVSVKDKKTGKSKLEKKVLVQGESDKRLLVVETEFSKVLHVMERLGNTLSPILRSAYDGDYLQAMTKASKAKATGAHISVIGHITIEELLPLLNKTQIFNGFGNRYVWAVARRSKVLPNPADINDDEEITNLIDRVADALEYAHSVSEMRRGTTADKFWAEMYQAWADEPSNGIIGVLTARTEPQVLRLSCIYALLDKHKVVLRRHIEAAKAVWDYLERSVRYIWRDSEILTADQKTFKVAMRDGKERSRGEIGRLVFNSNNAKERTDSVVEFFSKSLSVRKEKAVRSGKTTTYYRWHE